MKLTNKQHTDYCEILNDFRCKAIDIIEKLTKEYKNTLTEEIDSKLNNYPNHNEELICGLENLRQENKQLKEQLAIREKNIIDFISELAWYDARYDAIQSTMGDMLASRSAILNYAKRYFNLWKELFNEDLKQTKENTDNG